MNNQYDSDSDSMPEELVSGNYSECDSDTTEDESAGDEDVSSDVGDRSAANDQESEGTSTWNFLGSGSTSIEELIKKRDKIGIKKLEQQLNAGKKKESVITKRRNKNCPQEISSKKRIPFNKTKNYVKKQHSVRDPRFDALCGSEFNQEVFDKRFGFVDDIKLRERKNLEKQLKKTKDLKKRKELKYLISRNKQQAKAKEQRLEKQRIEKEWKQQEKAKVADGKKPYFLKQSEKEKLYKSAKSEQAKQASARNNARKEKLKTRKELANLNLERRIVK